MNATRRAVVLVVFVVSEASSAAYAQTHRNEAVRLMNTLAPDLQRFALARTVQSAGEKCQEGNRHLFLGYDQQNAGYYTVACTNGRAYQVQIGAGKGGATKILSCDILKAVKVDCWQKFSK